MTPSPVRAPLEGMRVVDFSSMIAGPYCTRLLADCGAEVIKVESEGGDHIRRIAPFSDDVGMYFGQLNCGKKSVVLNLKSDDGLAAARALIAGADVVVENFRPGVMRRLGLAYEDLAADRPDLVYCAISGFGQDGPRAGEPAYAPIVHAASGYDLAHMSYQEDAERRPDRCGIFTADVLAAVHAFGAIQTALLARERFGGGQFIDVALMDCMINLLIHECQIAQNPEHEPRMLYAPTAARDGFVIVTPISQRNFERMARAMGHEEWIDDPRFADDAARRRNWAALLAGMEAWTAGRGARDCEAVLSAAGVPCSRYRGIGEAIADPQTAARGLMQRIDTGTGGFLVPNPPFRFADGSVRTGDRVPRLGEHDDLLSGPGATD